MQSNTTTRIVNALSYLSILFLPVIFHAGALFGILLTFALLIALLLFIYNIAMAVKMLLGRE